MKQIKITDIDSLDSLSFASLEETKEDSHRLQDLIDIEVTKEEMDKALEQSWTPPTDANGVYDPTIELSFDQFKQLPLEHQVDYLVKAVNTVLFDWLIIDGSFGIPLPGSKEPVVISLDRHKLDNHAVGKSLILSIQEPSIPSNRYGQSHHSLNVQSLVFRPIIVGLLLAFLIKFQPEKYTVFANHAVDYMSQLLLGSFTVAEVTPDKLING